MSSWTSTYSPSAEERVQSRLEHLLQLVGLHDTFLTFQFISLKSPAFELLFG